MSSLINLVAGLLFLFKTRLRCCCFPDSYLKILTTIFVALIKPWRESIDVRNMDQISISNLIIKFYILNFTKTSVFQTVIGQQVIQSLISWEKSLKVVNNTFTIALWWRWLGKTLTQTSAYWISWQTWLIALHCSQKTFCFLCASNGPTSISSNISLTLRKSHENHHCVESVGIRSYNVPHIPAFGKTGRTSISQRTFKQLFPWLLW